MLFTGSSVLVLRPERKGQEVPGGQNRHQEEIVERPPRDEGGDKSQEVVSNRLL